MNGDNDDDDDCLRLFVSLIGATIFNINSFLFSQNYCRSVRLSFGKY